MGRAFLALALVVAAGLSGSGQSGKKVFISADMEGISGIVGSDQLSATGAEYGRSRTLMAGDVNAAIRGARAGGATQVVVNDSHGSMRNLRLEDLERDVSLISHSFKPAGMMEGLDETFDAVLFVGYHAQAGTASGLFAHTGSAVVADIRVNGRSVGEGGLNTMIAEWYGVPVALVTGDDVAVKQVAASARGARLVVVKRAINQRAAELRPLDRVRDDIQNAAREGVKTAVRTAPARGRAYNVELRFTDTVIPEVAAHLPGMSRPSPDTIAFTADTMPRAYTLIRLLYKYIKPA